MLKIVIDLAAAERMFLRLVDVHRFGNWRLFFNEDQAGADLTYDPGNTPPWIIHKEDLAAINALHRRLAKEVATAKIPKVRPEKSEGLLIFAGGCIVSKVIILIHSLLLTYNYYKVRTIPYPGRSASAYLNPEIVPDLRDALGLALYVFFAQRDEQSMRRGAVLSDLYAVMKILFDVLYGMLPCEEVARLREAYDAFHTSGGAGTTFEDFFAQLQAVSRRFAAEEPKWERERAESTFTNPTPVVPHATSFSRLAGAGSRPRKRIPVKVAAAIFEAHPNTISNWDKGKGCPPEYPGRDVTEELLRSAADAYFLRRHNEEQAKRNRAEGLSHKSAAPRSASGPDSTRREHDSGNFRISTETGRRTPT